MSANESGGGLFAQQDAVIGVEGVHLRILVSEGSIGSEGMEEPALKHTIGDLYSANTRSGSAVLDEPIYGLRAAEAMPSASIFLVLQGQLEVLIQVLRIHALQHVQRVIRSRVSRCGPSQRTICHQDQKQAPIHVQSRKHTGLSVYRL